MYLICLTQSNENWCTPLCTMDATWPGTSVENLIPFEWKASCGVGSKLIVELRVETSAQDKCLHFQELISGQNLPCSSPKLASQVSESSSWNISYKQLMYHWFVRMSTVQDIIFKANPMTHYTYGHSKECFSLNKRFQSGQLCQGNNTHPTDQNFFVRKQSFLIF